MSAKGENGTGGLLTIYSNKFINNNDIQAEGCKGGVGAYNTGSGGSSGGGSINIFYNEEYVNNGTISADGGNTNYRSNNGGPGGNGSITIGQIVDGSYKNIYANYDIAEKISKFRYTGSSQEYEVKKTGYYKIECWGAKGGFSRADAGIGAYGGKGGYTSGIIKLEKGQKLYVYVGQHGTDAQVGKNSASAYNGGGLGTWDNSDDEAAGAGGGATDIRLVSGEWNNFESLKSRIMVAAGGGGASWRTSGGAGGGLKGLTNRASSSPGTQISGYKFGIGQDGYGTGQSDGIAGSGGGYYGGTTSNYPDACEAGAGGSSFVSGYDGCNAISEESTEDNIVHTGQSVHYSNMKFENAKILNGNSSEIPEKNAEDGYVVISYIEE